MKVDFQDTVVVTPEWGGNKDLPEAEQFTVEMKPLTTEDLLNLLDVLSAMDLEGSDMANASMEQAASIIKSTQDLIPRYCTLQNLFNPSGAALSIDTVINDSRYMMLAVELFTSIMEVSQLGDEDEGN